MTGRKQEALFDLPRILDPVGSEAAAQEGMDRAIHAGRIANWKDAADEWLNALPVGEEFTTDKLYIEIGNPETDANRNNVVGAWVSAQAKARRLIFTGRMVKSKRVSRHSNLIRVWRKAW